MPTRAQTLQVWTGHRLGGKLPGVLLPLASKTTPPEADAQYSAHRDREYPADQRRARDHRRDQGLGLEAEEARQRDRFFFDNSDQFAEDLGLTTEEGRWALLMDYFGVNYRHGAAGLRGIFLNVI